MRGLLRDHGAGQAGSDEPKGAAARQAHARRDDREARIVAERHRARLRAVAVAVAVVVVVTACVVLQRSPLFPLREVEVVGTKRLSADHVADIARVPSGATLLRFPADEVAERVSREPWVKSVSVSRVFPDGMRIRVYERSPAAMVDAGKVFWLVDSDGTIIAQPSVQETGSLVSIRDIPGLDPSPGRKTTSEPLLNALRVLAGISPDLLRQVKVVSAPSVDGTTLYTTGKVEIVMGSASEVLQKDVLTRRILSDQRGKVVSIDVRTTDRPTWRGLSD